MAAIDEWATLRTKIQKDKALGDPEALILERLLAHIERQEARAGLSDEALRSIQYEASAGAQTAAWKLAQAAAGEAWIRNALLGLGLLLVGLAAGWMAHTPDWGSWPLAEMPTCQKDVCWVAFRLNH